MTEKHHLRAYMMAYVHAGTNNRCVLKHELIILGANIQLLYVEWIGVYISVPPLELEFRPLLL